MSRDRHVILNRRQRFVAAALRNHSELAVVVVGHCDTTEGVCSSVERAQAVLAELIKRGISKDRLSTRDAQAGEPIVDRLGAERAKNRRVSFEVR